MAIPESYIIPGVGAYVDTDQGAGVVVPGVGAVVEGEAVGGGRIMSSLAAAGGLAGQGGIAGQGGGLAA